MATVRIGMLFTSEEPETPTGEQVLGARLALDYTRGLWPASAPELDLLGRQVTEPAAVDATATDLLRGSGCTALLSLTGVPVSTRAGEWGEDARVIVVASNNNPAVTANRRWAFGIGVPSELTADSVARYLHDELRASRVFILNSGGEFQDFATQCTLDAMAERGVAVETAPISDRTAEDTQLLERIRTWRADAVYFQVGNEIDRSAELLKKGRSLEGFPPAHFSRSILGREFPRLAGAASEGQTFTDILLRNERAPVEERALTRLLAAHDADVVATANHAFGWDAFRLVAEAARAGGADTGAQLAYLEGLKRWPGTTGPLTFSADDHNGHWQANPNTIARLVDGRFVPASALAR